MPGPPINRYRPDARECALLLLRLLQEYGARRSKPLSRTRISELTLRRLWNRQRLTEEFLRTVEEWLLSAGWALLFAGSSFGAVRVDVVENWPRVTSSHMAPEIERVKAGEYRFDRL